MYSLVDRDMGGEGLVSTSLERNALREYEGTVSDSINDVLM
jgi:hypothetical protein